MIKNVGAHLDVDRVLLVQLILFLTHLGNGIRSGGTFFETIKRVIEVYFRE